MNSEERMALREAIDAEKRKRVTFGAELFRGACAGCGGEYDSYSFGCRTCSDRRHNRRKRRD